MTELAAFLASLYDSLSEAEMRALAHGQARLADLLAAESMPDDIAVPVYHASDVAVTLDVGLVAEQTDSGFDIHVTDADEGDESQLSLTVEPFELLDRGDIQDLDYEDIVENADGPITGRPGESGSSGRPRSGVPTVDVLDAIDEQTAERLRAQGVERLTDLVDRTPEDLAETLSDDLDVSPEQATDWLEEARWLTAILTEYEDDLPVELVDGIGPTFGGRLREAGVAELGDLVERDPEEVADLASTDETAVSRQRASDWIDRAHTVLESLDGPDADNGNDSTTVSYSTNEDDSTTASPSTNEDDSTTDTPSTTDT